MGLVQTDPVPAGSLVVPFVAATKVLLDCMKPLTSASQDQQEAMDVPH